MWWAFYFFFAALEYVLRSWKPAVTLPSSAPAETETCFSLHEGAPEAKIRVAVDVPVVFCIWGRVMETPFFALLSSKLDIA